VKLNFPDAKASP